MYHLHLLSRLFDGFVLILSPSLALNFHKGPLHHTIQRSYWLLSYNSKFEIWSNTIGSLAGGWLATFQYLACFSPNRHLKMLHWLHSIYSNKLLRCQNKKNLI